MLSKKFGWAHHKINDRKISKITTKNYFSFQNFCIWEQAHWVYPNWKKALAKVFIEAIFKIKNVFL